MDSHFTPSIQQAAYEGRLAAVQEFVEKDHVDPKSKDADGRTALHWAALGGKMDVVDYLLRLPGVSDSCANAADPEGFSPLISATSAGHIGVVRALISAGANANASTLSGQVPLHYHKGRVDVIEALLPATKSVDVRDRAGQTSLHRAAGPGHTDAARALLAAGASVNALDRYGKAPLHYACEERRLDTARVLLDNGGDAAMRDGEGKSALQLCGDARMRATLEGLARA